ncbi:MULTISPECIES: magnesium/cobalt transporter CorA [Aneurinibacillus]|uniref:Magnesium transport protein CorA n=1 Tax=Aneurinibacillus thermoaerophilus TaxID=143495 RepID=A0A1G8E102_ANETH|nr:MULTISPECIES: magnesium/cobalt transporter CorA [Aneurinibacillus]AMA74144.1 metal transporter [Aneurinibacillus sp. XH2]MED0677276.1 magnesium/cobalt transporter CorA [Aneurinibacillus thermoaerophilus]MED0677897.1 magnesium/cobalt transporter CorA [Aneurinibacillus thermoaerophilus]MED0738547.1 magnesium/cobalt transporter CorA [Aneurinibacillus thermoaerophilus]MED0758406.1 magnesium/cobalt transporter CorA [Aneurinibacillus thermoaerophilus]
MIETLALTDDLELVKDLSLEHLSSPRIVWYWVNFYAPTLEETRLLNTYFHFHPLAIEDCLHALQRPKVDYYGEYNFFVLHALNQDTLDPEEVDMFVGKDFIVTFHTASLHEIREVKEKLISKQEAWAEGPGYVAYLLIDKLVDYYFPAVYEIEDNLNELDITMKENFSRKLMDEVFEIRGDLIKLRRIISSMRDLLYRILNSERLREFKESQVYFTDVYDHLLRLSEIVDASRDITADMRDSYISFTSHRMNNIMVTLTIISSIFIPLTFIVGVYGMNFEYMPELKWKYGYFLVWGVMIAVAGSLIWWFHRKGWFDM